MKVKDYIEKYGYEKYLQQLEHKKQYRQSNQEKIAEYKKQYRESHQEKLAEYNRQYYQDHQEKIAEYKKQYNQSHQGERAEYNRQYRTTPFGRATNIVHSNNWADKQKDFDTSQNVDANWILENVFSGQCCIYCGESDWQKLGVDRINNTLPHIASNLVPCCERCNKSRQNLRTVDEQIEWIKQKRKL